MWGIKQCMGSCNYASMSLFVQDLLLSTYDLGHIISQIRTFFSHDVFLQEMNMK